MKRETLHNDSSLRLILWQRGGDENVMESELIPYLQVVSFQQPLSAAMGRVSPAGGRVSPTILPTGRGTGSNEGRVSPAFRSDGRQSPCVVPLPLSSGIASSKVSLPSVSSKKQTERGPGKHALVALKDSERLDLKWYLEQLRLSLSPLFSVVCPSSAASAALSEALQLDLVQPLPRSSQIARSSSASVLPSPRPTSASACMDRFLQIGANCGNCGRDLLASRGKQRGSTLCAECLAGREQMLLALEEERAANEMRQREREQRCRGCFGALADLGYADLCENASCDNLYAKTEGRSQLVTLDKKIENLHSGLT